MHAVFRLVSAGHRTGSFVLEITPESFAGGGRYVWHDLSAPGDVENPQGAIAPVGWLYQGTWEYDHGANSIRLYEGPGESGNVTVSERDQVLVLQNTGHDIFAGPRSGRGYIYRSANTAFQNLDVEWSRSETYAGNWSAGYQH